MVDTAPVVWWGAMTDEAAYSDDDVEHLVAPLLEIASRAGNTNPMSIRGFLRAATFGLRSLGRAKRLATEYRRVTGASVPEAQQWADATTRRIPFLDASALGVLRREDLKAALCDLVRFRLGNSSDELIAESEEVFESMPAPHGFPHPDPVALDHYQRIWSEWKANRHPSA
jgi:hypothetical protein